MPRRKLYLSMQVAFGSGVGNPAQLPATGRARRMPVQRSGCRDTNQFVQIFVYAGGLWHDREKSGMPCAAPCAWHAGAGSKIQSSTNPEGSILSLGFINPFLGPLGQYGLCRGTAQAPARMARPVGPCHAGGQMRLHPDARQHGTAYRAVPCGRAGGRPAAGRMLPKLVDIVRAVHMLCRAVLAG